MVNNIKQILEFLQFDDKDDFYHLQILKRKKENPELKKNAVTIKVYYITSKEHLIEKMDEIIGMCNQHNARAYINLNRRSFENVTLQTLKKITDILMNKDYAAARNAFDSVCEGYLSKKDKLWIIDIDAKDFEVAPTLKWHLSDFKPVGNKVKTEIPTKNGYHIITTPFNMAEFTKLYPTIDVHKNNFTLLYIP